MSTETSARITRELALHRLAYAEELRRLRLPRKSLGKARLFLDLRFLASKEEELSGPDPSPIPFHRLLSECSPFYRRVFKIGKELKIRSAPTIKSTAHFQARFNPFNGRAEYPLIKEELHWKLKQPITTALLEELVRFLEEFGFSAFHEMAHAIGSLLIPPPRKGGLADYFSFQEAFAVSQERYLSRDLGESLARALLSAALFYRAYRDEEYVSGVADASLEFAGLISTHLAYINEWAKPRMRKELPGHAPFLDSPDVSFKKIFMAQINPKWLATHRDLLYPAHLHGARLPYGRYLIRDFGLKPLIRDPKKLKGLWDWYEGIFLVREGKPSRRKTSARTIF